MAKKEYKMKEDDKLFAYIVKHCGDRDETCLNIARRIYGYVNPLRNMNDEQTRIQNLKDSPHVLKDEVYMKLEEALDVLEHLCSEDENMERWNDGLGIVGTYEYLINYRKMRKEIYKSLRETTVEGIIAEILAKRMKTTLPC